MKVLIAYDGSRCADDAIDDLRRAGLPADHTEALVLSASDLVPLPPAPAPGPGVAGPVVFRHVERLRAQVREAVSRARELAERAAARVRELFPGWTVSAEAQAGAPHRELVGKAAAWHADLLVVGSHGRSALGRGLLGSVSQQVIHHAPCAVRVGRRPADGQRPREPKVRLVLGFDGSPDAATAASAVSARQWPAATEVLVVGVVDTRVLLNYLEMPRPGGSTRPDVVAAASSELEDALAGVCDDLRRGGLAATASLTAGDPKKVLIQEAERIGADCIVVGAKGHTRLERLLLGSVSATVAARAHSSVEVVRQP